MVVLILCIILIVILVISLCFVFSAIKFKLIDFKITDYEDLKKIIMLIKNKEYLKIFNYLDFIFKFEFCVLKKVPILSFKISDDKIASFLKKQLKKHKLKKEEKDLEIFAKEDKKELKKDYADLNLESLDFLMNLGTDNASLTALLSTSITIIISMALPFLVDKIEPEKYNYEINPIYLDKPIFNLNASMVFSMPATDIIKLFR